MLRIQIMRQSFQERFNPPIQLQSDRERLTPYLANPLLVTVNQAGIPTVPIPRWTAGMMANRHFFNHPAWAAQYLAEENGGEALRSRYRAAIGAWDGKVVVDLGCGPGNWLACVGGKPLVTIGVDIAVNALKLARRQGYVPLLADVHRLPLRDGCADVVVANATLHHCDDVAQVLAEAARLVKPGGCLVTDLDPQASAWRFWGMGWCLYHLLRWFVGRSWVTWDQPMVRFYAEVHHQWPGDGVDVDLYDRVLGPLGFAVQLFPHNHRVGAAVLDGEWGKAPRLIRWAQWWSGLHPDRREAAQSVMCVARRQG
jgi:SAM-dependent methyltransferase